MTAWTGAAQMRVQLERVSRATYVARARGARRAAVSLEFAILAVSFLILLLATFEIGYDYFVQATLDNAVETAAREVQVGENVGTQGAGQALLFVQNSVCPALGGLLDCNNLYVSITALPPPPVNGDPPPDFYDYLSGNDNPTLQTVMAQGDIVCTGTARQMMMVQAYYLGPTFLGALIPAFAYEINGQLTHVSYSTTGFVNENFSGGEQGCG
jgi:hypothetical protein